MVYAFRVPHRTVPSGGLLVVIIAASLSAAGAWAEPASAAAPTGDAPRLIASAVGGPATRDQLAPASQPAPSSQPAFHLRFTTAALVPQAQPKLDLELHQAPKDEGPRFHRVKPFVELASYQLFLTGAGWLYGSSPLHWRKPTWEGWTYRISHAPIWHDGDNWETNYLGHAIMGSDQYLMARNCGWSWYSSIVFNTFGSFLWEYVTEGVFERPSAIDLVTTPILGSLLGEARYQLFRLVHRKLGKKWYAYVLKTVLDPTTMFFALLGWK